MAYDGRTIDTALDLHADSYSIDTTVVYYEGRWGMDLICGDIDGKNHNIISLGRGHSVRVVRDGTAYALAGTEVSMNEVRPGTTWQVTLTSPTAAKPSSCTSTGTLIADGTGLRMSQAYRHLSRNDKAGETYVRVVNAMDAPISVDLRQILAELNISTASAASATATVLAGDNPYAGKVGEESPTRPRQTAIDLTDGDYTASAWSFTTITIK